MRDSMKVLLLDIETAPNLGYIWGLWGQNISTDWLVEAGYTMCWAAKWYKKPGTVFSAAFDPNDDAAVAKMLSEIHELLSEADAVVTYNGDKFDLPTLNKEFFLRDIWPPAPYQSVDLLKTARKFRLPSRKLDYIAKRKGHRGKVVHRGVELWRGCMDGDGKAHAIMERYNKRDVTELEKVYVDMLPWIPNHPNRSLYEPKNRPSCPTCGSTKIQRRGYQRTKTQKYARYQCQKCGAWSRERLTSLSPEERKNVLVGAN